MQGLRLLCGRLCPALRFDMVIIHHKDYGGNTFVTSFSAGASCRVEDTGGFWGHQLAVVRNAEGQVIGSMRMELVERFEVAE